MGKTSTIYEQTRDLFTKMHSLSNESQSTGLQSMWEHFILESRIKGQKIRELISKEGNFLPHKEKGILTIYFLKLI